jgi:hypothetical protein
MQRSYADKSSMPRRLGSLLLTLPLVLATGVGGLLAWIYGFGLQCDESCGDGDDWGSDPKAWQWDALGWSGVAAVAAALALVAGVAVGNKGIAVKAFCAWVGTGAAFVYFFSGAEGNLELPLVVLVLVGALGAAGVRLLPATRRSRGPI